MSRIVRALVAATTLASWSCGSTEPGATPQVASVAVNPSTPSVALNAQVPLQAEVRDANGALVPDAEVTWTVQDPTIVSVSSAGVVTGLKIGTSQVAANALGKSGIATVTVTNTPVASVVVRPDRVNASVGSTTQLTAKAYDAAQNELTGRAISWTTSNAAVATVDGNGLVTAKTIGTATISAASGIATGSAAITVAPPGVGSVTVNPTSKSLVAGQGTTLTATVKDVTGAVIANPTVAWSSDNSQIAAVSATGEVTTSKVGTATISATSGGVQGNATITVTAGAVATVSVTPSPAQVNVGSSLQLTALAKDSQGNTVPGVTFTWISSNGPVATVTSSGVVTGKRAGTAIITATTGSGSGARSGSTTLTVN